MIGTIGNQILPITGIELPVAVEPSSGGEKPGAFAEALADAIGKVEDYRVQADRSVNRFLMGEDEELHKVAMATQQAELSFDLFLQVKNKVVQAYQEIMRMQL